MTSPHERNPKEHANVAREQRVRQIFQDTGVILYGHYLLRSGMHSDTYFEKANIWPHEDATRELCSMFVESFSDTDIDIVIGPETGGKTLSETTATLLSARKGKDVPGLFAAKDGNGGFIFDDETARQIRGKKILVLEDVITTGESVKKVIDLIRAMGGEVVGLGILCNRGKVKPEGIGVEDMEVLIDVDAPTWMQDECPQCGEEVPIDTTVGAGKDLIKK